ncbi:lipase family protein [Xenorhabdus szentirmaii]|uniref:lipase family protein n=2 Tax=Xenorhabdus szentirmaii TaxID=290112 RepID=UPI000C039141|nr:MULTISPECIES: lipase family protein [Xenorhabdus]MBD2825629.1 lipase family protein [Xenorhabdus sp. 5]PHM42650.1 phospholipase A1 [Xenorhabdus szentirmaii]
MNKTNSVYCHNCSDLLKNKIEIQLVDEFNKPISNMPYILKNRKDERKGMTDGNGMIREENLLASPLSLFLNGQKLADEMETRPLRVSRGEHNSTVRPEAESKGCFYRYAVIGELCDKAPDIAEWEQAKFGLPYYHFPKEDEFNGLAFYCEDFNQRHVIEVCPFRAWSLILKHTPDYDLVNAYNLGLMSLLVYKDEVMVDPDSPDIKDMRPFINTPNTTTSFFYQQCFDLSQAPIINDGSIFSAIVNDVPFKERYRPAIFLDAKQVKTPETFEHDTQMFFVENETQIIVAWRGTASSRDALTDATYRPIPCPENILPGGKAKVHKGFLDAYQCMEKYFEKRIEDIQKNSDSETKKLFICGHSLGGALALLHATELRGNNPLLYTYGMPRVFTRSGTKALTSLNHFRHVNDADTVPSVPFDTNMDNWLFDVFGPLGPVFGFVWTLGTLPSIPIQKSLPEMGEVYYHQGNTVSFFKAKQVGQAEVPCRNDIGSCGKMGWTMYNTYKFYLVPSIANSLDEWLKNEQQEYMDSFKGDKSVIDKIFPKGNNPNLDTVITRFTDHSMVKYQAIINNQLLSLLAPTRTSKRIASKEAFYETMHHKDAYPPSAKRNTTLMALENKLHDIFKQDVDQDELLKNALERYKEITHEIAME